MGKTWYETRFFVLDTETTGTAPQTDRIVELGAAEFSGRTCLRRYRQVLDPGVPIPEAASQVQVERRQAAPAVRADLPAVAP